MSFEQMIKRLRLAYVRKRYAQKGPVKVMEKTLELLNPKKYVSSTQLVLCEATLYGPVKNVVDWRLRIDRLIELFELPIEDQVMFTAGVFSVNRTSVHPFASFFMHQGNYVNGPERLKDVKVGLGLILTQYHNLKQSPQAQTVAGDFNLKVVERFLLLSDEMVEGLVRNEP